MKTKINDSAFYKAFFTMTLTMAVQNLIVFGVNLADSVMMGAYSETALSGVGICNNIQFFLNMAASGMSSGMCITKTDKIQTHKVVMVAQVNLDLIIRLKNLQARAKRNPSTEYLLLPCGSALHFQCLSLLSPPLHRRHLSAFLPISKLLLSSQCFILML